jgi:hypothetical protein
MSKSNKDKLSWCGVGFSNATGMPKALTVLEVGCLAGENVALFEFFFFFGC